ncbi:MAG: HAMP domain-containing protein, partial [Planctomycetota bacterium]
MSDSAGQHPPGRMVRPLLLKLVLIVGVPFALFSAVSLYFFTEWNRAQFLEDTRKIREEGEEEMRANTEEVLEKSNTIVKGLVAKITESNRAALSELPLEIWGVDDEVARDIKKEIRLHGEGLEERSLATASAINRVFVERAEEKLDVRVEAMRRRQERASALFSRRLQVQSVVLIAASILLLGGALWLGLWFTVLKPIRRLHEGTERVGGGDLSYRVEALAGDELGMLGRSFNRMSGELSHTLAELAQEQKALSKANEEIRDLNVSLEERVRNKTSELQESLAALEKAQAELIHAAKMAGIGTLAGGIAHEFNNMLG